VKRTELKPRRSPMKRGAPKGKAALARVMRMRPLAMIDGAKTFSDVVRALAVSGVQGRERRRLRELKARTPLRKSGAVAKREKAAVVAFREAVLFRAAGRCERCDCFVGTARLEGHHLVRRARCVGWPEKHDPEVNGSAVCHGCHSSLTIDPLDIGGPLQAEAKLAHDAFEAWRRDRDMLEGR